SSLFASRTRVPELIEELAAREARQTATNGRRTFPLPRGRTGRPLDKKMQTRGSTRKPCRFLEVTPMATGKAILSAIRQHLDISEYRKKHWEGTFEEYLDIVREHPEVTRTAYQRLYDMIMAHGTEEVYEQKEKITRFKFFTDFAARHGDAIYGLDRSLMHLVNQFKSAAKGYGTEKRVLLLHGPAGSSKSTIARLLKKGLEEYSRTDEGMLFSYAWKGDNGVWLKCPMHEEPLHLVPFELRPALLAKLNEGRANTEHEVTIRGDMCPF